MGWIGDQARRFRWTVIWSIRGWRSAWATERSLRQWTAVNVLSALAALALPLSGAERGLILALGLLVLATELMNTAIETIVNHILPQPHPMAARAKDCGSAAVALSALAGGAAWAAVLWRLYG